MTDPCPLRIQIRTPSGEREYVSVPTGPDPFRLGRSPLCAVPLRDPRIPEEALEAWCGDGGPGLWLRGIQGGPFHLAGIPVREALWTPGAPLLLGESTLVLEKAARASLPLPVPPPPPDVRHWKTISESGLNLLRNAHRASQTGLPIYLAGETGVGKEVLAHLLHAWSPRASGPFMPLHCGALALGLAESELFGHVRGAFTGADRARTGALVQAHGGTLFLDEVGDLPAEIQVKLLRFLENGEIRPVGSDRCSHAEVRLICATHLPLETLVKEGRFRRDLFFRLASITLRIPSLRERPEDVELLAEDAARAQGRALSSCGLQMLRDHDWPGNVRELLHAIQRATGLAEASGLLTAQDFAFLEEAALARSDSPLAATPVALPLNLRDAERALLLRALHRSRGNRSQAARQLGVARSTLFEMLKRHGVRGPRAAATQLSSSLVM